MKMWAEPNRHIMYAGESLRLFLRVDGDASEYECFARSTVNSLRAYEKEYIEAVEQGVEPPARLWTDLQMIPEAKTPRVFSIVIPLSEVGFAEFKCFYRDKAGTCHWAPEENIRLKVEPASAFGNNAIYNAFVRQFGPNMSSTGPREETAAAESLLDGRQYAVIPPSGRFRDLKRQLPFIMDTLGFRRIMLLPVFPVPTTYARMGRFGAPFAANDFYSVDPAMAEFDRKATPLDQFRELVDAIHAKNGSVLLDIPLGHTGWDATLLREHPEWYCHKEDGSIESPGAWGVVWEDLCKLDFSHKELWKYLADVLIFWCSLGVNGFRCDAGYMIGMDVWKYMTAKVRQVYPDAIFLLEGLGGPWDTTCELLTVGGLNWAYSESFQTFGLDNERAYLAKALGASNELGLLVNFAETHDNNRLAASDKRLPALRIAYSALLAPAGAYGITNGMEWLATEKIDVHGASSLNWGSQENIVDFIASVNRLLRRHPAFYGSATLSQLGSLNGDVLGLRRKCDDVDGADVLVLVNTSLDHETDVSWDVSEYDPGDAPVDLLTGRRLACSRTEARAHLFMPPATAVCVSARPMEDKECSLLANLQAMARVNYCRNHTDIFTQVKKKVSESILQNPSLFFDDYLEKDRYLSVVRWKPSRDVRRVVAVPANSLIYARDDSPFTLNLIKTNKEGQYSGPKIVEHAESIPLKDGTHMALLFALVNAEVDEHGSLTLDVTMCGNGKDVPGWRSTAKLLHVPSNPSVALTKCLDYEERVYGVRLNEASCGLIANRHGSYSLIRGLWGTMRSKYDAFLAFNPNRKVPETQIASLLGFRIWLRSCDFSMELTPANQMSFGLNSPRCLAWSFNVHSQVGDVYPVSVYWKLDADENAGCLTIDLTGIKRRQMEADSIQLIVRPMLDWRSTHSVTLAYQGAENRFPEGVHSIDAGFRFKPEASAPHWLEVTGRKEAFVSGNKNAIAFVKDAQWNYQVPLPEDRARGLEPATDCFSPGYFQVNSIDKSTYHFCVQAGDVPRRIWDNLFDTDIPGEKSMLDDILGGARYPQKRLAALSGGFENNRDFLKNALEQFIVKRDKSWTVIAGYPWFLDWGRDTLIFLRGLISAGEKMEIARDIICQFASFEENGTLPNMIRGNDTSDRDTSDAPLWLFVAVADYYRAEEEELDVSSKKRASILSCPCGRRTLREVLANMLKSLWNGAPNGVRADQASGLLFSPSHFTWMDTNYPAGTPRAGYPVEIQALWIHAMRFAVKHLFLKEWEPRLHLAQESLERLFLRKDGRGLSDCLHADTFRPAAEAEPDDAVRPNQLLAITLGCEFTSPEIASGILEATEPLLVPGGIRSLDDAPVAYPLPVEHHGHMLNDPHRPFWGRYEGDEDTRRKPAYHNGTAWGWQMPLYVEALLCLYGVDVVDKCYALLNSCSPALAGGCIGFLPEILDGEAPHTGRGCPAQAWSVSEMYRVYLLTDSYAHQYDDCDFLDDDEWFDEEEDNQ